MNPGSFETRDRYGSFVELEAFDTIDLCRLLEVARANRTSVPRRASIAAAIFESLASKFDRPAPETK
jgi:hypothetical protein